MAFKRGVSIKDRMKKNLIREAGTRIRLNTMLFRDIHYVLYWEPDAPVPLFPLISEDETLEVKWRGETPLLCRVTPDKVPIAYVPAVYREIIKSPERWHIV